MEPLYWLILLAILIVVEIATLGLTTIWFAGGAMVAFVLAMFGVHPVIQFVAFIFISIVLLISIRPIASKYFNIKRVRTNYESLIGSEAKVTNLIDNFNQTGTAIVNGMEWTARSDADQMIPEGAKVTIVDVQGVKLIVTNKKKEEV